MTSIEKKEESLYGEAVGGSGVASKRREPDCPSPATLAIVLIALFGSMFLIALDMVRILLSIRLLSRCTPLLIQCRPEHHRDGHSQNHSSVP